ncbi:hypothetical protein N9R54_06155, partial [Pelobium sp.]
LLITLAFPFLIAIQYHEQIQIKTMNIAIGIYVLSIATISRNLFIFFFLLCFAMFLFSAYGAYKSTDFFDFWKDIWFYKGGIVPVATFIGVYEKFISHVVEDQPFLPLKNISYQKR